MLKLYKNDGDTKRYWETWENDDRSHAIHWGALGTKGESRVIRPSLFRKPLSQIQPEIDRLLADGFAPIEMDDHRILLIEYLVDDFGNDSDLDKRHRLEERMNEVLGWTGLGMCDGGSIGSGTMEVCCYVVDFELAQRVISENLKGTEFEDFTRIYDERAAGT
jgi:hypothetical protein